MMTTTITMIMMMMTTTTTCLVPWSHYSARPKRFGSRGPRENVRPRQKSLKVRQKRDSSKHWFTRRYLDFQVKNTPLKETDGKGKFKECLVFFQWTKEGFFYKIVLRGIRNSENFRHRSAWPVLKRNQAAKFLKNFQVHFVLFSQENNVLKRELCISKH